MSECLNHIKNFINYQIELNKLKEEEILWKKEILKLKDSIESTKNDVLNFVFSDINSIEEYKRKFLGKNGAIKDLEMNFKQLFNNK